MEDKREYIEIDSTFRDRKLYPNPSNFIINVTDTGTTSDANIAINPLSEAYPIYNFQGPHPELLGINKDYSGNDSQFLLGGTPQSRFGGTGQIGTFTKFHEIDQYLVPVVFNTADLNQFVKNSTYISLVDNNWVIYFASLPTSSESTLFRGFSVISSITYGNGASITFSPGINSYGKFTEGGQELDVKVQFSLGDYSWMISNDKISAMINGDVYNLSSGTTVVSSANIRDTDIFQILYDVSTIKYYKNGLLVYSFSTTSGLDFNASIKVRGNIFQKKQLTDYYAFNQFLTYKNAFNDITTNPWTLNTHIGNNNFGPGTKGVPHLDGVPISKIRDGAASYQNIENENKTAYPDIYNFPFQSAKSYQKFPYSSTVNNYYDGLNLCRYKTQDSTGQNPNEINIINNYKSFNKTFKNAPESKTLFYNKGRSIEITDIDNSKIVYSNGSNACKLENTYTDDWNATDYWSINCASMLSVSNPQNVTIHGGSDIDDFYTNYYLEDCTMPVGLLKTDPNGATPNKYIKLCDFEHRFKKIISYDGKTKKALLTDNNDTLGFPICNLTTGYTNRIENNAYNLMNANPDRANEFKLNTGDSDLAYALGYQKSPGEFSENGQEYTWQGGDASGAKGWIPQDRYRIRKELPLVMGWGFNEDRDGARARVGGLTDITDEPKQNDLYTGTGPRNGQNGAVSKFEWVSRGLKFGKFNSEKSIYETDPDIVYGSGLPIQGNNNLDSHLYMNIIRVEETTGYILEATIAWPGYNFNLDQEVTIYNDGGNTNAVIKVTQVGQSIDLSNGFKRGYGYTTGQLSTISNQYNGELLYIPHKGPEKKSAQYVTKYHLTGHLKSNKPHSKGKDPPYIDQFPLQLKLTDEINNNEESYDNDETGIVPISTYITSKAKTLHIQKEVIDNTVVTSSKKGIWKGLLGHWRETLVNQLLGNTAWYKDVPDYVHFMTWNGGNQTDELNYGNGYLLFEDFTNLCHDDNNTIGIFYKQTLNAGNYTINLNAWRIKRSSTPEERDNSVTGAMGVWSPWNNRDVSGNGVFSIRKSDGTYVNNLPNPYDADGTMSLLPDTLDINGGDINKIQSISTYLPADEYTFIVKFVGGTAETTLAADYDPSVLGGNVIYIPQNVCPSIIESRPIEYYNPNLNRYPDQKVYEFYIATNTTSIKYYKNEGTRDIRFLFDEATNLNAASSNIQCLAAAEFDIDSSGIHTIMIPNNNNIRYYNRSLNNRNGTETVSVQNTISADLGNNITSTTGNLPPDIISSGTTTGNTWNNSVYVENATQYKNNNTKSYARINNEILKVYSPDGQGTTTLTSAINTTQPVNINVANMSNIRPSGYSRPFIKIGNEEIRYQTYSGNVISAVGMTRGYNGTVPATHTNGSTVSHKYCTIMQRGLNSVTIQGDQLLSNTFSGTDNILQLKTFDTDFADISGNTLPNSGTIRVGNEYISYTGTTGNTVTGVTRGINNTTLSAALPLAGYYDSNNHIESWQYITLPNNTVRNQYGVSENLPYYNNINADMPYLYVGAEKISWRGASGESILSSGWADPSGANDAWRLRRNLNKTAFRGYASNSEVIPALVAGGDGTTSTTYNITSGSGNDFPQNYTNCHVRIGGEYLKITNITANTISLQREEPYTLAASQTYSGTITQIVLATNSGKRRGLQKYYTQGSDNTVQVDGPLFYMSGGSNGSGGSATTRLIEGKCILVQDNNNNTETIIFKNPVSLNLGTDTFTTADTVISFCTQHLENAIINTAIDHPIGANVSGQKLLNDGENVTTSIYHPIGSTITSTRLETITQSGITGMAFMDTKVDVTIDYTSGKTVRQKDLYVGDTTGGIKHYQFGNYDVSRYEGDSDVSNNWILKGYISDTNGQIDVGNEAFPTFADMNNDGIMHMFVGCANDTIKFYRNTGTNVSPVWQAGITVTDSAGNNLQTPNTILSFTLDQQISAIQTDTIVVSNSANIDNLPATNGTITINSEKITYQNRNQSTLSTLTRGVDSTTATAHSANSPITFEITSTTGIYRPTFANIRGYNPARYDMFIGTNSGNIVVYENNGTGGPWDGTTTTWPFVKNTYGNGILTDGSCPKNPQTQPPPGSTYANLYLTNAYDFSGNETTSGATTLSLNNRDRNLRPITLWKNGSPNTTLFYEAKIGNVLRINKSFIPANKIMQRDTGDATSIYGNIILPENFAIGSKVTTKNVIGAREIENQSGSWQLYANPITYYSPWTRGQIRLDNFEIIDNNADTITQNKEIINFGQLSYNSNGRSWNNWTQSTGGKSITKEILQDTSAVKITLNDFNNLAEGGYISYNLGCLAKGSYKLSIFAESSSENAGVELYTNISKDDYDRNTYMDGGDNYGQGMGSNTYYDDHTSYWSKNAIANVFQGATDFGVINRGKNLNGRIIHNSLSELKGKTFTNKKICQQYTFQAHGLSFELRLGFNRDIGILRLNDTMTIYHVILTKEDVDADWIISNGYRDMSGVESDDNFFVDISGGQIPLDRTGTVGVVVTSKGFNEPVTGNVSNGINSNFGEKELYNFDLSGDAINFTGNIINTGSFAAPSFLTDLSGIKQLYIGRYDTGIIKYKNIGDAQNPNLTYDYYAPNGVFSEYSSNAWSNSFTRNTSLTFGQSWVYKNSSLGGVGLKDIVYIGTGKDSSDNSIDYDGKIMYENKPTTTNTWNSSRYANDFVKASYQGNTTCGKLPNYISSFDVYTDSNGRPDSDYRTDYGWDGNSIWIQDGNQLVSNFTYEKGFAMIENERVEYKKSVTNITETRLVEDITATQTGENGVFINLNPPLPELDGQEGYIRWKNYVGMIFKIGDEQLEIRNIFSSGHVGWCRRGVNGTVPAAHSAGDRVYISSMNNVTRGYNSRDYNGDQLIVSGVFDRRQTTLNLKTTNTSNANMVSHTLPDASESNPVTIRVGTEYISYTGKTNNSVTGVTRGLNNTTLGQSFSYSSTPSEIHVVNAAARDKFNPDEVYYIWVGAELFKMYGITGTTGLKILSRSQNQFRFNNANGEWGLLPLGGDGSIVTYTDATIAAASDSNESAAIRYPEVIPPNTFIHPVDGYANSELATLVSVSGSQVSIKREQGYYRFVADTDISGIYQIPSGFYIELDVPDNTLHQSRPTSGQMIWSGGSLVGNENLADISATDSSGIVISYNNRVGNRFYLTGTIAQRYIGMEPHNRRFTTGDTYISFCVGISNYNPLTLDFCVEYPVGTPITTSTGNFITARYLNSWIDQLPVTTMINHDDNTPIITNYLSDIDVTSNAVPALLDTGTTVDVSPTNPNSNTAKVVPKYDLYVGNSVGNIRRFTFGNNDNIDYPVYFATSSGDAVGDYSINWNDQGNIKDSGGNLIDVGEDAAPTFCKINNDNIYHMFVGNKAGYIKFYRNTGTNVTPIWQPGISVKDNEGFDIYSLGSAKPVLENLRGTTNPALNDLFIGNKTGNVYYYFNEGTGGPWDGSTTTWPFKRVPYKNGFLADAGSETSTFTGGVGVPVNGFSRVGMRNSYNWEILRCSQDGVKSFKYNGEKNSSILDYQIKLVSITIPNGVLKTGIAKRVSSNPYLYLELRNTNISTNNLISSNNPNARNASFKISIKDIPDLENSTYCKLDGDNIVQTIKLNLNESMKFKLYFGDGTEVTTNINDNAPPLTPNKDLQISAIFEIKKDQ